MRVKCGAWGCDLGSSVYRAWICCLWSRVGLRCLVLDQVWVLGMWFRVNCGGRWCGLWLSVGLGVWFMVKGGDLGCELHVGSSVGFGCEF